MSQTDSRKMGVREFLTIGLVLVGLFVTYFAGQFTSARATELAVQHLEDTKADNTVYIEGINKISDQIGEVNVQLARMQFSIDLLLAERDE